MFLIYLMACYGTTNIITSSHITEPLRLYFADSKDTTLQWLGKLVECPMCIGTYVGIGLYFFMYDQPNYFRLEWFVYAMVSSGFCWVSRVVLAKLGEDNL